MAQVAQIFPGGPFLVWIDINSSKDKYIHYNVWGEITYPFPNFNGAAIEVWE